MIYSFKNILYNHSLGTVIKGEKEVKLTKIQNKLLKFLLDNPKQIISKQLLMDEVWQRTVTENSIDQRIANLRSIIEADRKNPEIISTNFGQGYYLNSEVKVENNISKPTVSPKINSDYSQRYLPVYILVLVLLCFTFFVYWMSNNTNSVNELDSNQTFRNEYMNQFSVNERLEVTDMYASLPKQTRKKFRRFLSNVTDEKKKDVTIKLLNMSETERVEYIFSL